MHTVLFTEFVSLIVKILREFNYFNEPFIMISHSSSGKKTALDIAAFAIGLDSIEFNT